MPIAPTLSTSASESTVAMPRSPATFVVPQKTDRREEHSKAFFGTLRALFFHLIDSSVFQDVSQGREISIVFTAIGPLAYRCKTNHDVRNKSARSLRN